MHSADWFYRSSCRLAMASPIGYRHKLRFMEEWARRVAMKGEADRVFELGNDSPKTTSDGISFVSVDVDGKTLYLWAWDGRAGVSPVNPQYWFDRLHTPFDWPDLR